MKKRRIVFAAPTLYPYFQGKGFGGAELQIWLLAKMFARAGHEVFVAVNDYGQPETERRDNVTIIKIPLRFLGGSNLYFLPDTINFVRRVRRLSADFLLMKTPNAMLFQLGLVPGAKKVKLFASDEDALPARGLPGLLYSLGVRMADGFVFQTAVQQKLAKHNFGVAGRVIRNLFVPPEPGGTPEKKDVDLLWVGGFEPWKQPEKLIELIRMMPERRFTVIAKPCPPNRKALEAELVSLPNVDYTGTVPAHLIAPFYRRCRIFLCTSKYEGFPNTFLQSWYELAAVSSLEYPCDGVLERFDCGVLAHGSVEKMAEQLNELLDDEPRRLAVAVNGRRYVEAAHLEEKLLPEYENFFDELEKHLS
ncbi:MAG: glycosyltransferase family 4 protein [Victivallaceae bacterium]|nr:glycosyltransferase family 4 protein [Victivallaceae bacterium]